MSNDTIKRSDAIGAITNHCENECYYRVDNWCPQCQREEFEEAIKAVPSADIPKEVIAQITFDEEKLREIVKEAVERFKEEYEIADRPQGKWEEKETFSVADDGPIIERWQSARCSMCERYHTTPYMYYFNNYNFCPNCGADMREREGE